MTYLLVALLLGLSGRMAAGFPQGKIKNIRTAVKLTHGLLWIPLFGWNPILLALAPIFFLGEKPGVGHMYGFLARKQYGVVEQYDQLTGEREWTGVTDNVWVDVAARGAIYPALVVTIAWWIPETLWLIPIYAVSNVLSFIVGWKLPYISKFDILSVWGWSDFLRHFIAVGLFYLIFIGT